MKNLAVLVALLSCFWTSAIAQKKSKPAVSDIRAEADGKRLKVTYNLQGTTETDSVYLQVESRTRGVLPLRTVSGAIGKGVEPGPNNVIYWDYALDGVVVDEFKATVNVKPATTRATETKKSVGEVAKTDSEPGTSAPGVAIGGGPAYALLSAVLPGIGNIFVHPNRKIGFRPLITASYVGLLAYGLSQRSQSNKQYDLYSAQLNETDAQPFYDAANQYHQRYFLATRAAAVILATDVAFTLLKGIRNQKLRRAQPGSGVSLQYQGTTPTLAFRQTF